MLRHFNPVSLSLLLLFLTHGFADTAHYQQWVAREALLARLRSSFIQSQEADSVMESLSQFVLTAIDEQPLATEDEKQEVTFMTHKSAATIFRQK